MPQLGGILFPDLSMSDSRPKGRKPPNSTRGIIVKSRTCFYRHLIGNGVFNKITSYRIPYPECCVLGNPKEGPDFLCSSEQVDHLLGFTIQMWDILRDAILEEWFQLRLPTLKVPWDGPIYLPFNLRLAYCLDRSSARQATVSIEDRYISLNRYSTELSIFAGYGLNVPNDLEFERCGLTFVARQSHHFRTSDDYLFIVQETGA